MAHWPYADNNWLMNIFIILSSNYISNNEYNSFILKQYCFVLGYIGSDRRHQSWKQSSTCRWTIIRWEQMGEMECK